MLDMQQVGYAVLSWLNDMRECRLRLPLGVEAPVMMAWLLCSF